MWLQEASQHCGPPNESREICPGCICTETTGGWSLLRPGEGYESTWQYGIIRDMHRIGLRGRFPAFVAEYLRDRRIRVRIATTLWWILPRRRCPNWWCIGCYIFWAKDQRAAISYFQRYHQSTLCWWPGDLFSWPLPGHHRETFAAGRLCHTGMGDKEWFQSCGPQMQSRTFHCTPYQSSATPEY